MPTQPLRSRPVRPLPSQLYFKAPVSLSTTPWPTSPVWQLAKTYRHCSILATVSVILVGSVSGGCGECGWLVALNEPGAARGELRYGMLVPNEPADVFDVARLLLARPSALLEELLAASRSVELCELKLLMCGLRLPAVPGRSAPVVAGSLLACCRPIAFGSGEAEALILSSESLLKIAIKLSWRGKITVSRNVISVMRRTSSSSPRICSLVVPPAEDGLSSDFRDSGVAPQKSCASLALRM